ncbi:hypothetical protein T484DRAFT_1860097 [Baffinella frigidus]|nr:hypothetical protein T484DRAFT_1860097 [Cryptophyta sp. CCMP2293]
MHLRVAVALLVAVAWLDLAAARPDFAAAEARMPSVLRSRRQPVSSDEPRRFKQTVRAAEDSSGEVHLQYDVVIAQNVRVLDDMEGVERVQCHRTSLELSVISASIQDVWDVLEPGDILHGGPGWGCVDTQANDPEAGVPFYFKVVRKVSLGSDSIHLETRPVSAFSVFERASITMWKDDVSSPLSSRRNAGPGSAGGLHTSTPPRSSVPRSHHPPTTKPLVHFGNSTGRAARQRGGTDAHLDAYDVVDSSTVALPHLDLVWTKDSSALGLSMYGTGDASVTLGVDLSITVGYFYNLEMTYSGSVDSCTMYVVATPVVELSLDATAQASSTLKNPLPIYVIPFKIGPIGLEFKVESQNFVQLILGVSGNFAAHASQVFSLCLS